MTSPYRGEDLRMTPELDRRTLLGAACVGCVSLVAACGGGSGDSTGAAATGGASPSATSTAGTGGGAGTGNALAQLDDIEVGSGVIAKTADGKPVVLSRTADQTVVGFSAICTHAGCTVGVAGDHIACPCHGSQYALSDGHVLQGPARKALPPYAVQVTGGAVVPA